MRDRASRDGLGARDAAGGGDAVGEGVWGGEGLAGLGKGQQLGRKQGMAQHPGWGPTCPAPPSLWPWMLSPPQCPLGKGQGWGMRRDVVAYPLPAVSLPRSRQLSPSLLVMSSSSSFLPPSPSKPSTSHLKSGLFRSFWSMRTCSATVMGLSTHRHLGLPVHPVPLPVPC